MPLGGHFLECYLNCFAPNNAYRAFRRFVTIEGGDDDAVLSDDQCRYLLELCGAYFYGWIIGSLYRIAKKGMLQKFFMSFLYKFYGLSRMGRTVMHQLGDAPSIRYCDAQEELLLKQSDQNIRYSTVSTICYSMFIRLCHVGCG